MFANKAMAEELKKENPEFISIPDEKWGELIKTANDSRNYEDCGLIYPSPELVKQKLLQLARGLVK